MKKVIRYTVTVLVAPVLPLVALLLWAYEGEKRNYYGGEKRSYLEVLKEGFNVVTTGKI